MQVLNCWEFTKCGREPGGAKVAELGVCPVALAEKYDKINRGKNAGRICWLVGGSLCDIKYKGKRQKKQWECSQCKVFQIIREEEGDNFIYFVG